MKLVKQSYEILEQEIPVRKPDDTNLSYKDRYLTAMYKHIEKCGRTCYKSENRITENSAGKFVKGLIKSGHLSVLEHGVIYLAIPDIEPDEYGKTGDLIKHVGNYNINPYSKSDLHQWEQKPNKLQSEFCRSIPRYIMYVTTNYRVIIENGWEEDLQYLCEPTEYHDKRHSVLLHTCIHTYKDITRHRKMSFSIESTRYCNYSKTDKFGEMKFILPPWVNVHEENTYDSSITPILCESEDMNKQDQLFVAELCNIEDTYNMLIKEYGWQPQQAAEVLPQCTAADVVISGFDSDWDFVFRLRSDIAETGKPHPLVEEIMTPLRNEFINQGWILPF